MDKTSSCLEASYGVCRAGQDKAQYGNGFSRVHRYVGNTSPVAAVQKSTTRALRVWRRRDSLSTPFRLCKTWISAANPIANSGILDSSANDCLPPNIAQAHRPFPTASTHTTLTRDDIEATRFGIALYLSRAARLRDEAAWFQP